MNNWKHWMTGLAIGMAALMGSSLDARAEETPRTELMEVVRDVEINVAAINEHAAKLDQMVQYPNRYSLSSYQYEWSGIRNELNEVGELVPKLQKATTTMDWQKEVINEMTSSIKAMEIQVEKALAHVNDTVSVERLYANDLYELRITSIVHYANHIDELVEYLEAKFKPMT